MATATYEPPTTKVGTCCTIGEEPVIAKGVRGYAVKREKEIWIPLIMAENEGSGDVGRFLDSLSPRCAVVNVTSPRLVGMLKRRGWEPNFDGKCDVWRKEVKC
jgi:hypothetical protein